MRGLRLGADDWITKPCHPEEVIARVQSVVRRRRRAAGRAETKPLLAGEVEIRSDRFQAFVGGHSIDLTRREFELIELLAAAEGRVLEREEIYSRLWGYAMVRGDRSVDVFVRKLRQKLEKASPRWRYIHTHFGIGYRFAAESLDVVSARASSGADIPVDVAPAADSVPVDWDAGDEGKLARAQQEHELADRAVAPRRGAPPSSLSTARPPFFRSIRPPVSSRDDQRQVGLVSDQQQATVGAGTPASARAPATRRSRPPAADARAAARAAARSSPRPRARRSCGRAPSG